MRWSSAFIPTLKENPQEAEAVSHKLMVRAGLIRRLTAGAYTYLPMGYRVLRKTMDIIREEMDRAGAVELLMPALQPPELWKRTGRYDDMGDVMIKYTDRHGKEVALGPTHEEVVTDLVSGEARSYKDFPLCLYQVQTKFRDEIRPRFGVVRSCEFIMKDAYSFDVDAGSMEKSYKAMYDAYCRIFERCGLPYVAVEADPGLMGGTVSHEFMVPSEIGEDRIVVCASCGYAASVEIASVRPEEAPAGSAGRAGNIEDVVTPDKSTVRDVSGYLKVKPSEIIKTLIYMADNEPVAVLIRGDHDANETKIKNYLKARTLALADERRVKEVTGGPMGFSGPVGLSIRVLADTAVRGMAGAVTGANEKDKHIRNVTPGRDFSVTGWFDARVITGTDPCPKCGGGIEIRNAIEIGHTFKLGTKYSEPLNASFLDAKGRHRPVIMGCYGIGVNRIPAALIEASHDKDGIVWPASLSPCEVVVMPLKKGNKELADAAERIYEELKQAGVDVIIDDRERSPGIKFKDADLVGFPIQVIIGEKNLKDGKIEVKERASGKKDLVDKDALVEHVRAKLRVHFTLDIIR
ncbi:MAG: proline--tRNA ligase [Candidatus Makaraimicrobium thalassicum]|nr:MAG: proline--tRNA ligase [Candidatus Omnitrophota bacterium]